jgi:hypothetical protein
MKKILFACLGLILLSSCERVAPNYKGVLMENFGKSGKKDFKIVTGRVNTIGAGTELFQVPMWEQRASFADGQEDSGNKILHLKAADNTEFTSRPSYSYSVIDNNESIINLVFNNARLGSGDDFMRALENNILEAKIYDIMKDASRSYSTDTLMASGGSLRFENSVREQVSAAFTEKGLKLQTFTAQLDFSDKVKSKIDTRNEVNTNVTVLDQQIIEQNKRNELAKLQRDYNIILSEGITPQLLQQQFIEKWDGKTPLYGQLPVTLFKQTQ